MNKNEFIKSEYRYERKFFITELSKYEIENIVKLHPAMFFEKYNQRFVNNIYFDSSNLKNYYDNIDGTANRMKIRVRWYGDLLGRIKKPILQLKIKKGFLGKKISIPMKAFELNETNKITDILHFIKDVKNLIIDFKSLSPSLLNRYSRKYYQSCDGHYRITIDSDQECYQINKHYNSFLNRISDRNTVILELKYNQAYDSLAGDITTTFPFRITKNSKYVSGVQKLLQVAF